MMHPQYTSRQHRVPVPHEFQVIAVVARDTLQAVGEFLALRKQLLEVTEATGHGFAPRIDDNGAGQDAMDQTNVPKVVRHFVDEAPPVSAVHAGVLEVLRPETV